MREALLCGDMFQRVTPRLAPAVRLGAAGAEQVTLEGPDGYTLLQGRLFAALAPLLDGRRSVAALLDQLSDYGAGAVFAALAYLVQRRYVAPSAADPLPGASPLWGLLGADAAALPDWVGRGVQLTVAGPIPAAVLAALAALDLHPAAAGPRLVLTDDYHTPDLPAFAPGAAWLLARPVGSTIWVGPRFGAEQSPCLRCLAARLRATPLDSASPSAATTSAGALVAAAAIAVRLAPRLNDLPDQTLLEIDPVSLQTRRHTLLRAPGCPGCRAPRRAVRLPLTLRPAAPRRVRSEEATLAACARLISPLLGPIRRVEPLLAASAGPAYVYRADYDAAPGRLRSSFGKGATSRRALVGALGEAVEHAAAYAADRLPIRRASAAQLGRAAVHPDICQGFSPAQYRSRTALNATGSRYLAVPEPFDPTTLIDWTLAWSLTRRRWRYLPLAYCTAAVSPERGGIYCRANSNGCAAGSSLAEAILRGFLELVERDSVALWWYSRAQRPGVDLASFAHPLFAALTAHYATLGRSLEALDVTADLGIPVFVALGRPRDPAGGPLVIGFGAGLDATTALLRALAEANQALAAALRANASVGGMGHWVGDPAVTSQPYLRPLPAPARTAADYPSLPQQDAVAAVRRCVALARRRGLETLAVDLTPAAVGLCVVKVVVPGLRHFWPRLGPGRLYTVPPTLGWIPAPLSENDLNPVRLFQ